MLRCAVSADVTTIPIPVAIGVSAPIDPATAPQPDAGVPSIFNYRDNTFNAFQI
jgi:hypothetical protein